MCEYCCVLIKTFLFQLYTYKHNSLTIIVVRLCVSRSIIFILSIKLNYIGNF